MLTAMVDGIDAGVAVDVARSAAQLCTSSTGSSATSTPI